MHILVTHPGRQHSHELARALHERSQLYSYWTGVPSADPSTKGPLYRQLARMSPQPTVGLPADLVTHNYVMPLVRRLVESVADRPRVIDLRHRAAAWFDAWSARHLPNGVDAVIAYENAARDTFRVAKKKGLITILDAASFHHTWQDDFHDPVESDAVHRRITRRKDEEIQLADHIFTVSGFARGSYVDAGVPPQRVTSVPMGVDLSRFTPEEVEDQDAQVSEPFRFLFAGHADRRKGVDVLLASSEHLKREGKEHQLQFAGGGDDALFESTNAPVDQLGYLDHSELAAAFRGADCLVLPSRHDSFGRVVVEAMATGLPVLLSEHVGAKEVVTEDETGWVVPAEDRRSLTDQMRWCIEHPEEVWAMHDACVETAKNYSWAAYRERAVGVLNSVLG